MEYETYTLVHLAGLRATGGAPNKHRRLPEEAVLALARGDKATARHHAKEAHRLATCDGPPDYTYKAAYDEAGALLKQLG